ncbi:alpha-ketoglutarate-dependent dioxygenase alkB homolog 6 [Momordica charantia]|uniref:Alpha-ketoglutarate-dependent dioxygenase alkB homolog 6 n=1 Tax=Momordica charantia TaxID=3673 RepID=A0A6J1BS26_MOMCH|nr:alpha-ketoglutarate-dependent dioxygenase alkB homolog 6 [Momordica charantia]XP_022132367.1 alpha-ketoglutarate-dependent dioxygenase alkB homolog 6 [Momordica charantia]
MESVEGFNRFKLGHLPTVFYIPDFVKDYDEILLLDNICKAPVSKWKSLKNRRLQNWGGVVHEKGLLPQELPPWLTNITKKIYEESSLYPEPINHVLINEYLPDQGIMPHQDGPAYFPVVAILSLGSPVVMDFTPHSRLISCTDKLEENFNDEDTNGTSEVKTHRPFSILLMPRSLLIFKDEAYSDYLHGIKDNSLQCYDEAVNKVEAQNCLLGSENANGEVNHDHKSFERTSTRVSLTCRLVPKVHRHLIRL